jgi:hypothetical protein
MEPALRSGASGCREIAVGAVAIIGRLVDLFTPHECANDFSSCGYDPD